MKTYNLPNHVTVHDISKSLRRPRQTVMRWIKELEIPYTVLPQGKKLVATFIAAEDVAKLRGQSKESPR